MKSIWLSAALLFVSGVVLLPVTAEQGTVIRRMAVQDTSANNLTLQIENLRKRVLSEENGNSREQRVAELEKLVTEYFETKQKRQMDEVERLKRDLATTEALIQKRNERKTDIVKKMVDDVLEGKMLPPASYPATYRAAVIDETPTVSRQAIATAVPAGIYSNPVATVWEEVRSHPNSTIDGQVARVPSNASGAAAPSVIVQPSSPALNQNTFAMQASGWPSTVSNSTIPMIYGPMGPVDSKTAVESVMRYRMAAKLMEDGKAKLASGVISSTEVIKLGEEKETAKAIWEAQLSQIHMSRQGLNETLQLERHKLDRLEELFEAKNISEASVIEARQKVTRLESTLKYLESLELQCGKLLKDAGIE